MWKVLGVTPLLLENTYPISLPEADNNAKPYWKIRLMLNRLGFLSGGLGAGGGQLSVKEVTEGTPLPAARFPRLAERGSERRRASGPRTGSLLPHPLAGGAGRPLLTGARREAVAGKERSGGSRGPASSLRGKFLLTQTLRTVLTPLRGAARRRWRRRSRAGNGGGKGAVIILHARPRGRSEAPLRHLRFDGEKRGGVCSG